MKKKNPIAYSLIHKCYKCKVIISKKKYNRKGKYI